jgi:hypothetical protein
MQTTQFVSPILRELRTIDPRRCYHAVLSALEGLRDRYSGRGTFDPEGLREQLADLAEVSKIVTLLTTFRGE